MTPAGGTAPAEVRCARRTSDDRPMGVKGMTPPKPSRSVALADARASALLGSALRTPALVVTAADAFPAPCPDAGHPPTVVDATTLGTIGGTPATDFLPFPAEAFASVVDTAYPEVPGDYARHLNELVRVCRPGGEIACVAYGGTAPSPPEDGFRIRLHGRAHAWVRATLEAADCEIVREVPFDVLGPLSPWRLALGARAESVLAELEEHLQHRSVRRAVRLVERGLVATLDPSEAARVVLVARRRDPCAARTAADGRTSRRVAPGERVRDPTFTRAAVRLLHDDAVLRWLAFLDVEILSPLRVPFDLPRWVAAMAAEDANQRTAAVDLLGRRRWWYPGLEERRVLEAASYRLAQATLAALTDLDAAGSPGAGFIATLEYDLVAAFNARLGRTAAGEAPA
jgi:hypothetical protein